VTAGAGRPIRPGIGGHRHTNMDDHWNTMGCDPGGTYHNGGTDGASDLERAWTRDVDDPSAVVAAGTIVAACANRRVEAFDLDGSRLWSYSHPDREDAYAVTYDYLDGTGAYGSNPAVVDGSVYHVVNDRLVALDLADGAEEWHVTLDTAEGVPMSGGLRADDRGSLFVAYKDALYRVDTGPGAVGWSDTGMERGELPVLGRDGTVVQEVERDTLRAVDPLTGRERWTDTEETVDVPGTRMAVDGGTVFATQFNVPTVRAMDAETGRLEWSRDATYHWLVPDTAADRVFAIRDGEQLAALDSTTGSVRWTVALDDDESPLRSARENLYLAADRRIVRRDPASGAVRERSPDVGFEIRSFLVDDCGLVVAGDEHLALLTGDERTDGDTGDEAEPTGESGPSFCPGCGADLDAYGSLNFCPECGRELSP